MVSTVGELWQDRAVREIHAQVRDPEWLVMNVHLKGDDFDHAYMQKFGYQEIGYDRKYETMVFEITGEECQCGCGLPKIVPSELDSSSYNDAKAATEGHEKICRKWERHLRKNNKET